jgi:hypothetical protein
MAWKGVPTRFYAGGMFVTRAGNGDDHLTDKIEKQIQRTLERLIVAAMDIQAAANHLMDLRRELITKPEKTD